MKAIVYTKYGPPDDLQLKEVTKPSHQDNEVLVKILATTVNRNDWTTVRAKSFFMRIVTGLFKPPKKLLKLNLLEKLKRLTKTYPF